MTDDEHAWFLAAVRVVVTADICADCLLGRCQVCSGEVCRCRDEAHEVEGDEA